MTSTATAPSLIRNVLSNWFVLAVGVAYTLFITPIIVRALGQEQYGVWSFLNGLLAYSDVLYFGLGAAFVKYVAECRAQGDQAGVNRLASVVTLIYGALGGLCLLVALGLSAFVAPVFAQPLSPEVARAATLTCVLLGAQLFFVFVGSAFVGLLSGYERYDLANAVYLVGVVIRFVATPLLVREGHEPLITLAVLSSAVAGLGVLLLAIVSFRVVPGFALRLLRPTGAELARLYGFGLQSFFIIFAVKLISYTDTTVIGVTLGAASVALYTLPLQLVEYARAAVTGFSGVFLPRLAGLAAQKDHAALREAYLSSMRFACVLSGWMVASMIVLGPAFLNRWVGPDFGTPVQMVLLWLAVAAFGQVISTQVPLPFYQALHIVAVPAAVLTLEAAINLGLSLWLAPRLGIVGVAVATVVPALLVSGVVLPPYLCKRLELRLRTLCVTSVVPGLVAAVLTLALYWLSGLVIHAESYLAIATRAVLTLPVPLGVFAASLPVHERAALRQRLVPARGRA
jgi:O-antigen/teichoic acid export membrane protein